LFQRQDLFHLRRSSLRPSRLAAVFAFALAGAPAATPAAAQQSQAPAIERLEIEAQPLAGFDARDTQRRRFGSLDFRGGLVLSSAHKNFGGVSSIRVLEDGGRFLAVTDRGYWLRGRVISEDGKPRAITDAEIAPMLGPGGRRLASRRWYDTESLALDGGTAYVGLERVHQIVRFDFGRSGVMAQGSPIPVPAEFRNLPSNAGIEALAVAPKRSVLAGALIAISERALDDAGNIRGFLIGGPSPGNFAVRRGDEFDITDAAIIPDGDLLILERKFSLLGGPGMRIRRIAVADLKPGAVVDGPVLIEADAGYQIDNMEALSAHRAPNGALVLTIVSDNNFSMLQRTLLLQFTLVE
jgi:hypothetical protein